MKNTIKTEVIFESPLIKGAKAKKKKINALVKFSLENKNKTENRKPLNITYVIDTSGSMNGFLSYQNNMEDVLLGQLYNNNNNNNSLDPYLNVNKQTTGTPLTFPNTSPTTPFSPEPTHPVRPVNNNRYGYFNTGKTQLALVKEAVIHSLNYLKEEDTISIVSFDTLSHVLAEGLTIKDKSKIIMIINNLSASGSTNLLAGWKDGVKCITNTMSKNSLNRIVLLTDGEVNRLGNENIPEAVRKIKEAGISTSAFGVGLSYNEDLLMSIAENGDGNYYYIKETGDFKNLFSDEFENVNNIMAKQVKMCINDESIILLNEFKKADNFYHLPNILKNKSLELLITLSVDLEEYTAQELTSKKFTIIYQDRDSNECKENIIINIPVVDKKDKFTNKEVKEKIILNEVAKNKQKIAKSLDENNFDHVSELLEKSKVFASGLSGQLQTTALNSLAVLENSMACKDYKGLRKSSLYDSYNLVRGKER